MNYSDIAKVNGEISMIDLKGKNYAMVPERVTAFRKLFPDGFISTEIIENDGTTVLMKATAGYYREDGTPVVLGSGMAQEVRGKGMVNGTSHIENCETSAVGRALGMIGLGINGGGICSAEELVNAITAQNQMKQEQKERQEIESIPTPKERKAPSAEVHTTNAVPKAEGTAVKAYLLNAMKDLREARGISIKANNQLFSDQKAALVSEGLIPNKPLEEFTLDEAQNMVNLMYSRFTPNGKEVMK